MHQPHAEPRSSLYYRYKVHAPWRPPSAVVPEMPVAIVGAGPIGLSLALDLARHGVRCVLLESELQVSEGSRAIVFTRRSMEILQQVGVDQAITAQGLPWRCGNSYYRGQRVFRMEAPHRDDDRFHPMINLQQQYLEEALVAEVARQPLVELRWGQQVTGLARDAADGVVLQVDTPFGGYAQPAQWVVACDGARSALRQQLDLRMQGDAYEGRFVIADIRVDLPFPTERLAFFDPVWNPGNTVLMHREPQGIWRIDYQLPPGETAEEALAPASLKARIDAQLAMVGHAGVPWALDWSSVYSARAMTLPAYRQRRVLFAGDAAHLLPIFGVRGANTGWQDAHNLGWKLAAVAKGVAPEGLLDSYSHERVGAAREIIAEAGRSTRFMTPPSAGFRLVRDAVLALSLRSPFVGPLFHWRTSRPHDYLDSPLNALDDDDALFGTGPAKGCPLPNMRLGDEQYLLDHFGPRFWLVHLAPEGAVPTGLQRGAAACRAAGWPVEVVALRPDGQPVPGADLSLPDPAGRLAAAWAGARGTACYLVRPDQHVAGRWLQADAAGFEARLADAVRRAVGQVAADAPPCAPQAGTAGEANATDPAKVAVAASEACAASAPSAAGAAAAASLVAQGLSVPDLEQVYDALAAGIDAAPASQRLAMLTKLGLLMAQQLGDAGAVQALITAAGQDLLEEPGGMA